MRNAVAGLLMLVLVGCSGDDADPNPSTTAPVETSTTTESVAPSSTALPATSATSAVLTDNNPGTELIGITEKITITITDPED